jgi:hypothetical protein
MIFEPAKVFEDRLYPGDWRVEWEDARFLQACAFFSDDL